MEKFVIKNISELKEDVNTWLGFIPAFDFKLSPKDGSEPIDLVRVSNKTCHEYVKLGDILFHQPTQTMFLFYEDFITLYTEAMNIPYTGTFKKLYDEEGSLFALGFLTQE